MLLKPQLFVDDFAFLEAPKWHAARLWLSDVFDHKVYAVSPDGKRRIVCEVPNRPAGLGFLPDGTLIIVSQQDRKLLSYDSSGLGVYADLWRHAAGYLNDFAMDGAGRIYVGNFGYDYFGGEPRKKTVLHRVDRDGTITTVADNVDFPNGSVVMDGGATLLVAETWECRITAFALAPDGTLSRRRVFADLGERQPDGICADAEGAIWVGCFNTGEFVRVLDGGKVTHRVQLDGPCISCTLGGHDGRRLFLTAYLGSDDDMAAGKRKSAVLVVDVEVPAPNA